MLRKRHKYNDEVLHIISLSNIHIFVHGYNLQSIFFSFGNPLYTDINCGMRKAKKILADDYEIYIFHTKKKNNHCSNVQGLGNMLNEESF